MDAKKTGTRALLNPGEENEMELFGYRTLMWRQALCIIGYIFSLGFLLLLFYWKPEWDVWCQCAPCALEKANVILLRTTDNFKKHVKKKVFWVKPLKTTNKGSEELNSDVKSLINKALIMPECKVRCLRVQKIRYVWNTLEGHFQKIGVLEDEYSCSDIQARFGSGLSQEEQEIRKQICGLNKLEVEVPPIWKLFFKEVLNPYYIFQAYSLSLWFAVAYYQYTAILLVITLFSIAATIFNMRKQSVKLHKMVSSHNSMKVTILNKNGDVQEVESQDLVPGDVIVLTGRKFYLPCDSILITGSCVVNEGMLTGESVPVTKTPLPNVDNSIPWKIHSGEDYKRHVLFCGTEVIQTQAPNKSLVKAVVLKTGFNTAKGDLVRSILYPKPVNFKLHRDAIRFLLGLVAFTLIGLIYTPIVFKNNGASTFEIVIWTLNIISGGIPAALPAAVQVCILYSQVRLQRNGIFCLSAQRINMCGQLNIICFDKTGTLTEDGMELWGIVPSDKRSFQEVYLFTPGSSLPWSPVLVGMVSCHSLIFLDGKTQGDPLDLKMFEGTGWILQDADIKTKEDEDSQSYKIVKPGLDSEKVPVEGIAILHQFPFSSSLQRMSVIVEIMGEDEFLIFMKGAPEMVAQFCTPDTVPLNYHRELELYTSQGFRVIALAYKTLATNNAEFIESLEREEVESDLVFLGFLIMENKIKPETKLVIQELTEAKIRTVMITGDNLQTACTIGKASDMIPPGSELIVVEANAPKESSPASITWGSSEKIQDKSKAPQALKVAHAGISLSELEASVASPFTSKIPNIECVPKLIKEGRNCLVTSFCVFKYIAMYAIIGCICALILFWKSKYLGVYLDMMQDVAITIAVTLTMSLTGPAQKLAPYRPSGQLISPPLLLSIVLHTIFCLIVQTIAFTVVQTQPFYDDYDVFSGCLTSNHSALNNTVDEAILVSQNFLTTTMWFISGMNLMTVEFVFCKGKPFRKPIYTNYVFTIIMIAQLIAYLFLYFANIESLYQDMQLVCTPYYWRRNTIIMVAALFVVSYLVEEGFIENRRLWLRIKSCFNYRSRSQYRVLERALCDDPMWPPISQTYYSNQSELGKDVQKCVYDNPMFVAETEQALYNGTEHRP
ncbi:putative cation-transporting ATPase 13A4 isoform X2 [Ranitomeya variabilis]|uniref:putative cation-transporting ATPase 13A4 isoform X2 n=1 Tax=Ranitomeya variabilis TaxID=490064 RepID=UPI0040563C76